MKRITFVLAPNGNRRSEARTVNLESLSPTARRMAEIVSTLVRADDMSLLYVRGGLTQRQRHRLAQTTPQRLAELEVAFAPFLDTVPVEPWSWDALRTGESAENYFERHAAMLQAYGYEILGGWRDRGTTTRTQDLSDGELTVGQTAVHLNRAPRAIERLLEAGELERTAAGRVSIPSVVSYQSKPAGALRAC